MNVLSLSLSLSGLEMAAVARRTRPAQVKEAHISRVSRLHKRVLLETQKDAVKGRRFAIKCFLFAEHLRIILELPTVKCNHYLVVRIFISMV